MSNYHFAQKIEELWSLLENGQTEERLIFLKPRAEVLSRLRLTQVLALDYDGTASKHGDHPTDLDEHIGPEWDQQKQQRRRAVRHDIDIHVHDHDAHDQFWMEDNAKLYADAGMELRHFIMAGTKCQLRPGAQELLSHYGHDQSMIVSMGVADIIEAGLQMHGIRCTVAAMRLKFQNGRVIGRDPDHKIVTGARKGEELARFCAGLGLDPRVSLAAGDSWGDRTLLRASGVRAFVAPTDEHGNLDLRPLRRQAINALHGDIDVVVTRTLVPLYNLVLEARRF